MKWRVLSVVTAAMLTILPASAGINNGGGTGGGTPSGPAGGDLYGTFPNPDVAGISAGTALVTTSFAPSASQSALLLSGAPYTAGTTTTNYPLLYLNDGTAPTSWNSSGTEIGINAPSTFTGNFLDFHVSGGQTLFRVDYTGLLHLPAGLSSAAALSAPQIIGNGYNPTVANGPAAGTSPGTPTIAGTPIAGVVTVITGTSTTSNATLATITFFATLSTAPWGCSITPRNVSAAGQVAMVYTTAPSTTSWTIAVAGSAIPASTTYSWSYICE